MKNLFTISHRDPASKARAGVLRTAHGDIETPVFMPVGTQGTVKTLGSEDLLAMKAGIILSNTYHLFLRPGLDVLKKAGGLHRFMAWPNAILTDSGGYQVFSLAARCRQSEEGVEFASHVDGVRRQLTPEITTRFQLDIGADIAMCLDDCPPYPTLEADARTSMEKTLRWAKRCRDSYDGYLAECLAAGRSAGNGKTAVEDAPQLLFGISQGASFLDMRRESSQRMAEIGFPGYAVGGLGIGEPKELMWQMLEASVAGMPDDAPHYMMGIGQPEDMWDGVERGVDMFDCVLPTRNGRNGQGFTSVGKVNVPNARYREDFSPLDPECRCPVCSSYERAYLCHLFRAGELLGPRLVTLHNLWFMLGLLRRIRRSIIDGDFRAAKAAFLEKYRAGEARV